MTNTSIDEVLATSEKGLRDQALQRVKKRRDFHTHVFSYVTVNTVLWGIWAIIGATSHSWYPWPLWITLGWAIGLIFNAWDVYFRHPITEADIRREMDRLGHGAAR
jgi:hypothetical protein